MDIIIRPHDNTYVYIECEIDQAHELKEFFSCYTANYKYHPKYKAKMWDGKIKFFNTYDRLLPIGLVPYLKKFKEKYGYKIINKCVNTLNDISDKELTQFLDILYEDSKSYYPRDYQQEAILCGLQKKRGIIESCTGSGKSSILYSIIRFIMEDVDGKILLIVPSINLVTQMYSDMKEYGWDDIYNSVSLLYGKSKSYDPNKKVLISTWQSIYKKSQSFFEKFSGVLVDEAHNTKSDSIMSVLKKCVNAEYKLGLTGTLPTETIDRFNIFGSLGIPIYQLKSRVLIDRGYLTDIRIVNTFVRYSTADIKLNMKRKYAEEIKFIIDNENRNKVISYIIDTKYVKDNENVLILAQRLNHIDKISKYLKDKYPNRQVLIINGKTDADDREKIRKDIENLDGVILIATYGTLSTGVNIPKLHHVIFASFYKSKIKVLQSIGRGLRKHTTKKIIFVWDIIDDMRWKKKNKNTWGYNYAYQHYLQRQAFYKEQQFACLNKKINLEDL